MTRRVATTLTLEVRLPVPAGSNTAEVTQYVRDAIKGWKGGMDPQEPITSLAVEQLIVKLVRKDTVYL